MTNADVAMHRLSSMVDDTAATAFFKKGGPLDWFSLTKMFVNAVKKNALTEKQCDLIDKVYAKHCDTTW